MERVTISLEESLLAEFDRYIARKGYQNRSEAIRDLVRDRLETESGEDPTGTSVGCVSYVYNHHQRDLAQRQTNAQTRFPIAIARIGAPGERLKDPGSGFGQDTLAVVFAADNDIGTFHSA